MRFAILIGACVACVCGFGGEPLKPSSELLTKDDAKDVEAVVTAVIAAGFPDASKAEVHLGKLHVSATFDPAKDPPLPSSASQMQMTNPNTADVTFSYEFDGLHFKLADGTWLISLNHRFKPKAGDSVNADDAPVVNLADLTASAGKEVPFDAEKNAAKWLENAPPANRVRAAATMNKFVPVLKKLKLGSDDLAPAIVLLHKAGWTDALGASLVVADQRSRNFWQLRPWTGPGIIFDPSGVYPNSKDEEAAWKKAHAQFTPEAPNVALRRALYRWCRGQMMVESSEDAFLPLAPAATCAKAMADPKDPQGLVPRIDALLAGAKLPATPPEKASLVERLQSWEARARTPRLVFSGGNGGQPQNGAMTLNTGFAAPASSYTPKKSDLDELIGLLGDERPSRYWDFNGSRTLGENAWRAAAKLLDADPRKLAGYPTDKVWNAAEQKAAAAAVQKWWAVHKKEYLEK